MADDSFQLSALTTIRDKASGEVNRAREALTKAQEKLDKAEMKLKTLNETIELLSSGSPAKSQKDLILQIINAHDGDGLTAVEILTALSKSGVEIKSSNPTASIHMAAEQLEKDGIIEIIKGQSGKLFKRKAT